MVRKDIVVFGGSGFIGRYLVQRLASSGWRVTVAVRRPDRARFLQPLGDVGQIVAVATDITDARQVTERIEGAGAVVNLVGILHEKGTRTFSRLHAEGARLIAEATARAGVRHLVHVSAIGASPHSPSSYARSKAAGEDAVRAAMPDAPIVRPGIVFGPEDGFFNLFGRMAALSPVIPLIGGGTMRFQPVHVGDVASAIVACLDDASTAGKTYELGGPSVYTFRHLMEFIRQETRRRVLFVPVPFLAARALGSVLQNLPNPPLTLDQVRLMQSDIVVQPDAATLADLGIEATALEMVVPSYLKLYRRGGSAYR